MAPKTIIADLKKSEKLNVNCAQYRRDLETYKTWKKVDSTVHGIIVSFVVDDLIHECKEFQTCHAMWHIDEERLRVRL